jgi:hypothetical protein
MKNSKPIYLILIVSILVIAIHTLNGRPSAFSGKDKIPTASELSSDNKIHPVALNSNPTGLAYNYIGTVGGIKIKANIIYKEAYHVPGSGAIRIPIGGYYFYESVKVKIPIKGECNGAGKVYFTAATTGGTEYFDGNFVSAQLGDITGTWSKGSKSLYFRLNSL